MQSCSPKGPRMIGEGGRDSGTHREREAQKTEGGHLGEIQLSQGRHGYLRNIYQAISPQGDTIASEVGSRDLEGGHLPLPARFQSQHQEPQKFTLCSEVTSKGQSLQSKVPGH